jgi:predicted esterase YcpF (UPF0227 family)
MNDEFFRIDSQGNYVPPYAKTKTQMGYIGTSTRFVRASQSLFKKNFDGTHVVEESVAQHKYSRLAMTSYYFKNQTKAKSILSNMTETKDFQVDKELSTVEHSILHNPQTKETVIAFRGTSNLKDVGTDALVLTSQELKSNRFKESQKVFEATAEKYGRENIVTTGHSLGGSLSINIAQLQNIEGHHFNPAISARQVDQSYTSALRNNTAKQTIYRTHGDPVSIGGELTEAPLSQRETVRVHVRPENTDNFVAHHQLNNFYTDDGVREGNVIKSEKATLLSTGLDTLDKALTVTQLGLGTYDAIDGAKHNENLQEYQHQISEDFNPLMTINVDPDFHYTDVDVLTPLYKLGKTMRSTQRRKEDKLMTLGSKPKGSYTEQPDGTIRNTKGTVYRQVPNTKPIQYSAKRRSPLQLGITS